MSITAGPADVRDESVQVRKQLGELPAANGSDYRQSLSSAPGVPPASSYPESWPKTFLLKFMKQLKKQKQLMKAKHWALEGH